MDAQPSPDGARIVWMSQRTGFGEIWTSGAAGESLLQLTHIGWYSGTPRWSPDGKWIAFDSASKNGAQIFTVDSQGRNLHPITGGSYENVVPSWSRDGKSIYFSSNRNGSWQVWKHSVDGATEVQVTRGGGFDPIESYDGQTIYFSKIDGAGIWSIASSGGMESTVVADKPQVRYWGHWAVTKAGLYLLDADADPKPRIEFYDFATRRTTPVLTFEKRPVDQQPSLSATADGKTVYYTQVAQQSAIKMMELAP
jgi:Tol biopolymer transport system component